jgi:hypothetical protein
MRNNIEAPYYSKEKGITELAMQTKYLRQTREPARRSIDAESHRQGRLMRFCFMSIYGVLGVLGSLKLVERWISVNVLLISARGRYL